jgi:hypothetical protein
MSDSTSEARMQDITHIFEKPLAKVTPAWQLHNNDIVWEKQREVKTGILRRTCKKSENKGDKRQNYYCLCLVAPEYNNNTTTTLRFDILGASCLRTTP